MDKETIMQLLADGVISNEVATKYFPDLKESRDERIRQFLIRFVRYYKEDNDSDDFSKEDCLAWLEGHGEQKSAWSEDDEMRFQSCLNILQAEPLLGNVERIDANWVKSLKERIQPQNTWKPSEHELEVLKLVAEKDGTCLMGLYKQLKKLREE